MDQMMFPILIILSILNSVLISIFLWKFFKSEKQRPDTLYDDFEELADRFQQKNIQSVAQLNHSQTQSLAQSQMQFARELALRQDSLQKSVIDLMQTIDYRMQSSTLQNNQQLQEIRTTVEAQLEKMRMQQEEKLEAMRHTVDEKLQVTLETRLGESFRIVSERLEQVHKGLGEMQSLAVGVGDLKKVLSNVKTRGILGEVQLGAIIEQVLSPGQYQKEFVTKKGSRNPVEFAVLMPGADEQPVYLPIDAKFPLDAYLQYTAALEGRDPAAMKQYKALFISRVKTFAKDIHDKYIDPPSTTDFAVMFLPVESIYAQILDLGLFEPLSRDYKVMLAGPTTMAALLNSLQMGFQTLAIQKRSSEVWTILGDVKTEFDRFGAVLDATQQRLEQTSHELDKLVGVRTRMIQRRLSQISKMNPELPDTVDSPDFSG